MFVYEALRLFGDKLVSLEEYNRLCNIINETVQSNWNKSHIVQSLENYFFVPQQHSKNPLLEKLSKAEWTAMVQLGIHQCGIFKKLISINSEI